jgi:hypothetical protein
MTVPLLISLTLTALAAPGCASAGANQQNEATAVVAPAETMPIRNGSSLTIMDRIVAIELNRECFGVPSTMQTDKTNPPIRPESDPAH